MKNQKRNQLIVVVISAVLFLGVLLNAIEALVSRNGASLFISVAVLWLLGTVIKSNWIKLKPIVDRLPDEDAPMDMEIEK